MAQAIRFCKSDDGVRLAYAVLGQGPMVLYVCGWPERLDLEWQQPFARTFLERLSRRCTLVRYDMRGSGLSDRDTPEPSLERLVADVEVVANQLGRARFHLLSLGMLGGPLALHYAVRHPDRVDRLFLYGAYLRGEDVMTAEHRHRLVGYVSQFGFPHFDFIDGEGVGLDEQHGVRELQRAGADPGVQAAVLEAFFDADLTDVAPKVTVPTMIVHADRDPLVPVDCARALAALVPDAQFNCLPADSAAPWAAQERLLPAIAEFFGTGIGGPEPTFTRREREVLDLLIEGMTNAEIAASLHISEKTVKTHVGHILAKTGARNQVDAVASAMRQQSHGT